MQKTKFLLVKKFKNTEVPSYAHCCLKTGESWKWLETRKVA